MGIEALMLKGSRGRNRWVPVAVRSQRRCATLHICWQSRWLTDCWQLAYSQWCT